MSVLDIRTVQVARYIKPLREGGSLPAIVEGDDGFLYVLKFRGAGQGTKALSAELIGGELARAIGLHVPELVLMQLDASFSSTEGDEEIQDLLKFSVGLNLGLHFLSGAITYDPLVSIADPLSSSKVVLLDSIISNIDRTVKNTNLLNWNNQLWLIDHGASLYFHHNWNKAESHLGRTFPHVKEHVLLDRADELHQASEEIKEQLTTKVIHNIVDTIPDEWLVDQTTELTIDDMRQGYINIISDRIQNIHSLVKEANDAK